MMLANVTLRTIGMIIDMSDDKEETKNAMSSILNDNKKKKQESPIEIYIKEKIEVLKDFGIDLSQEQITHIETLPNEYAIDRYCRPIILGLYS